MNEARGLAQAFRGEKIEQVTCVTEQPGNAMLVISVANRSFSSDFLEAAIPLLLDRHALVRVLIADELMIYNRFDIGGDPAGVASTLGQYRHDRRRQLERIVGNLADPARVKINTYEDFCDHRYARIYRRIMLMASQDPVILEKLRAIAAAYLPPSEHHEEAKMNASILYLLDETAWTMNLAAHHGMTDNYYPGDVGKILRIFYCDSYDYDVFDCLGIERHTHRFWRLDENGEGLVPEMIWAHEK
ncbi:hypothetical protein KHP62_17680 [Rhodobacteraceae bacterium NNCM2]|nr:hypothetical protein [Coraliihabitans acroporae]